jgi:hypothetical protein
LQRLFSFITDSEMDEAMGVWKAVSLCLDRGCSQMVFEGDALNVIKALQQSQPCWSPWGQLLDVTRSRLNAFLQFQLQHVRREANHAAHYLAKLAVKQLCDCVWLGECPPPISDVILAEQVLLS